jgi:hypothetical protein
LDKNSINFASVYGLKQGTGLTGQDYSWLSTLRSTHFIQHLFRLFFLIADLPGSIFYFGYLIAQWPAGLALQKLPVGKFLAYTTLGILSSRVQSHIPDTDISSTSMGWSPHDNTRLL